MLLSSVYAPVLEFHLVAIGVTGVPSRRQFEDRLTSWREMPAAQGSCRRAISWSSARGTSSRGRSGRRDRRRRGLGPAVGRKSSSAACCYAGMELSVHSRSLVTDTMGTLVNQQSVQTDLALLFGLVAPQLPEAESIALAAGLSNADRVWEGDPAPRR